MAGTRHSLRSLILSRPAELTGTQRSPRGLARAELLSGRVACRTRRVCLCCVWLCRTSDRPQTTVRMYSSRDSDLTHSSLSSPKNCTKTGNDAAQSCTSTEMRREAWCVDARARAPLANTHCLAPSLDATPRRIRAVSAPARGHMHLPTTPQLESRPAPSRRMVSPLRYRWVIRQRAQTHRIVSESPRSENSSHTKGGDGCGLDNHTALAVLIAAPTGQARQTLTRQGRGQHSHRR